MRTFFLCRKHDVNAFCRCPSDGLPSRKLKSVARGIHALCQKLRSLVLATGAG